MPPETLESRVALEAAQAGADVVARYYENGVEMRSKESYNLVSDADLHAEEAVAARIRETFPGHAILGEEIHSGETSAEHLWIIDPLDGTNNFAHRVPHFGVSVAYYRGGRPHCGVVLNPARGETWLAAKGQGAWHNGEAVHVGTETALNEILVGVGFYYDRGAMMEATLDAIRELFRTDIHGIRRFGTASLDLCLVGSGCFGAFFEYELSPWDFAAGRLVCEEAGGKVTTCDGRELPIEKTSLLATNGLVHEAMLEIVARHLPPSTSSE